MLAKIIYKSLIDKPEIKLSDNCFFVNDTNYFINDIVFQKIKRICKIEE